MLYIPFSTLSIPLSILPLVQLTLTKESISPQSFRLYSYSILFHLYYPTLTLQYRARRVMFAHMSHVASARSNGCSVATTRKSFSFPACNPELTGAERSSGLSDLPSEVIAGICAQLGKADIAKLARTCSLVNDPAERQLLKHLNLVPDDSELGPAWRKIGSVPDREMSSKWVSQNAYRQLIRQLQARPDLALSVRTLTVAASFTYPRKLVELVDLLAPTLTELEFRAVIDPDLHVPMVEPWYIYGNRFSEMIKPLPFVTKMTLSLGFDWVQTWRCALAATPFLTDLSLGPLFPYTNEWERDTPRNRDEPARLFLPGRGVTAPPPKLPRLKMLSIAQMTFELEETIMDLIKTSSQPTITLCLHDAADYYHARGEIFSNFLREWQEFGRLRFKLALPAPDCEERVFFQEEEDEAFRVSWEREKGSWTTGPDVEEGDEGNQEDDIDFISWATWASDFWTEEEVDKVEGEAQVDEDGWPVTMDQ